MNPVGRIWDQLARMADLPAVTEVHPDGLRPVSGAALVDRARRVRSGLRERGIEAGDRVMLLGPNGADWVAIDLAALAHGAIVVPIYVRQSDAELAGIVRDCQPALVVVADDALAGRAAAFAEDVPVATFTAMLAAEPEAAPPVDRADDDVLTLIYTSGTSGEPKGVQLTVANVAAMLPVTSDALAAHTGRPAGQDVVFHYLPLCFAGSRVVLWTCLWRGNGIHLSMDLDRLTDEIAAVRPHYFLNVPVLLERVRAGVDKAMAGRGKAVSWLYRRGLGARARVTAGTAGRRDRALAAIADRVVFAAIRGRLGGRVEFLICGSAPLAAATQAWFEAVGIPVYQVYGLTETTAIVSMDRPHDARPGTVGRLIPGCEARLTEDGELLVRGPNIFPGYWRRDVDCFADGWFRTGDQATLNGDRLAIVGRVKHLLVPQSGHNVAPEPVEEAILSAIPGLTQVVLVGHGRPHLAALLFGEVTPEAIAAGVERVNASLPHYKRVRAWHHRPAPLTDVEGALTPNGKLKRKVIEERFAAAIEGMYR